MDIKTIKARLKEINSHPIKKLGQNFLTHKGVIDQIVNQVKQAPSPWVEIGPGLGSLTDHFLSNQTETILIEKDKKIVAYWKQKGLQIYQADALKFDWNLLPSPFTLFGNLPYQLAASLVLEMTSFRHHISQMVLMMQKEVAQRLICQNKNQDYGILSVMGQIFWQIETLVSVSKNHFYPVPQVDGTVLIFKPKESDLDARKFLSFVKLCFSQRRKKLLKQLPSSEEKSQIIFSEMNLDTNVRAEELSPIQLTEIYHKIYGK